MRLDVLRYAPTLEDALENAASYLKCAVIAHKVDIIGAKYPRWWLEAFNADDAPRVRDYNIVFQYNQYLFVHLNYVARCA